MSAIVTNSTIKTLMSTTPPPTVLTASTPTLSLTSYYPVAVKGLASGAVFYGINMTMGTNSTSKSQLTSAIVVGVSTSIGSMLRESFVPFRQSYLPLLAKTSSIEGRLFESGTAILGTYVLDRAVLKNSFAFEPMQSLSTTNIITIIVSDVLAEIISDIFFNRAIKVLDE